MKRHGYLFERIVAFDNLLLAGHNALRKKIVYQPPISIFI
jgi:hypothetical protein